MTYVETVLVSLLCWVVVGLIIGYEFARVVRR
jgi:hypothetical protein